MALTGFGEIETHRLNRLAREGVLFEQTSTVTPLTLPAHSSVFTGRFPPGHGVRDNGGFVLGEEHITLAEILSHRGFQTGAFIGSFVAPDQTGLSQGFRQYGEGFTRQNREDAHSREGPADQPPPRLRRSAVALRAKAEAGHDVRKDEGLATPFQQTRSNLRRPANEVADDALMWMRQLPVENSFFAWVHELVLPAGGMIRITRSSCGGRLAGGFLVRGGQPQRAVRAGDDRAQPPVRAGR